MAHIERRGDGQYRVQIRRRGFPKQDRTFFTRDDAETWALTIESEMKRGVFVSRVEAESTTLSDALTRYLAEVTPRKKSAVEESNRIKRWQKRPLAACYLASIKGKDLAKFRDERRREGLAENTIRLDLALLSSLFETARREWNMEGLTNPVRQIKAPAGSKKRERRLLDGEQTYLVHGLTAITKRTQGIAELVTIALETGMRQSEILGLSWEDVDLKRKIAHLDDTKSGDPRDVPLSPVALATFSGMPRPIAGGRIWSIGQDRLIRAFRSALPRGRKAWQDDHPDETLPPGFLVNLRFHDLRHEAASRWAPYLGAQELCKMFGWKTMQMALRYYHPTGESLADKLAKASAC